MNLSEMIKTVASWNDEFSHAQYVKIDEQRARRDEIIANATDIKDAEQRFDAIMHYLDLFDQSADVSQINQFQVELEKFKSIDKTSVKTLAWLLTQPLTHAQASELEAVITNSPFQQIITANTLREELDSHKRHLLGLHYKVGAAALEAHHLTTGTPSEITERTNANIHALDAMIVDINHDEMVQCEKIVSELNAWVQYHQDETAEYDSQQTMQTLLGRFKPNENSVEQVMENLHSMLAASAAINETDEQRATSTLSVLTQQLDDLVAQIDDLENYYHIDPSVADGEIWAECMNKVAMLHATVDKFNADHVADSLTQAQHKSVAEIDNKFKELDCVVDYEHVSEALAELNSDAMTQTKVRSQLIKLVANPWFQTQVNQDDENKLAKTYTSQCDDSVIQTAKDLMSRSRELFNAITADEFFNLKSLQCPNYLRATTYFNQMSNYVSEDIVCYKTVAERAASIAYWLDVADHCRTQGDYNCVAAINAVFTATPVYRLKATWASVPAASKKILDDLKTLFNNSDVQKQLRDEMESRNDVQVIPYIGPYRTRINSTNEKFGAIKMKLMDLIDSFEKLDDNASVEAQTALALKITGLEKGVKGYPDAYISVLQTLKDELNTSDNNENKYAEYKAQIKSVTLSDFPEAIIRNEPVLQIQSTILIDEDEKNSSEMLEKIDLVDVGAAMDNKLYDISKQLEPKDADIKASAMFTCDVAKPSAFSRLKNRFLRKEIIQHQQVITMNVTDEQIEAVNETINQAVSDTQLSKRLETIGVTFDKETLGAINSANKQMRYHNRIDNHSLQTALEGIRLKSTTAGKLGGKNTKTRIDELTDLATKGQLDRATLEYKLGKLVGDADISEEQYKAILAEYATIEKSKSEHHDESKFSHFCHKVWDYVHDHPFKALGFVTVGAVAIHAAPFIPIFGAKAYAVGAGTGLSSFLGSEEVASRKKESAASSRFGFFGKETAEEVVEMDVASDVKNTL